MPLNVLEKQGLQQISGNRFLLLPSLCTVKLQGNFQLKKLDRVTQINHRYYLNQLSYFVSHIWETWEHIHRDSRTTLEQHHAEQETQEVCSKHSLEQHYKRATEEQQDVVNP